MAPLLLVGACRARPPETRIVVVTATPAPVVAVAAVALPTPEPPPLQSAEFSFPVPAPPTGAPPTPLPAAPVADEPVRNPVAESVLDQLSRCVTFRTDRFSGGVYMPFSVLTQVRATNVCNTSFSSRDAWIEVRAIHAEGGKSGVAGSKITRFQGMAHDGRNTVEIPARGTADLLVQIDGLDQSVMYRFETVLSSREEERDRGD